MLLRLYTPVYALTLLLSATLLFFVQPMFSKMILPLLGGTPQVWNTAMLFFQVALLAGYAYAHGTTRFLSIRAQAVLHLALLFCFIVVLPLAIPEGWLPPIDRDPTLWQLSIMGMSVGGPFFILAASAPMLQRWFSHSNHPDADNPYFLYGASNLGSISALLAYPVLAEPLMNLAEQSHFWMFGYFLLIALIGLSAALIWPQVKGVREHKEVTEDDHSVTWKMRLEWVILTFIPSSLMLGVTTFITTDVGSAPLLWVVPLSLYVGTFILVFSRKVILKNQYLALLQGSILAMLLMLLVSDAGTRAFATMFLHMALFFVTAWMCHGILAAKRPDKRHLTEFYLLMSVGGALGGLLNAIIAPQIFTETWEYPLVLAAACFCRFWGDEGASLPQGKTAKHLLKQYFWPALGAVIILIAYYFGREIRPLAIASSITIFLILVFHIDTRWIFAGLAAFTLLLHPPAPSFTPSDTIQHSSRNFFGTIKVVDGGEPRLRTLMHGTTAHGMQSLDERYKTLNISYYSEFSPLNDAFVLLDKKPGAQNVAILGLGSGATACFDRKGRHFDFFEIDPAVVAIAENPEFFTYLSGCGSPYDIVLGDARMTIQAKPEQTYDLILLDVFSSDNIPIHVLTEEAVRIYLSKIKPDGLVVFHISNNYLNLEPVLSSIAEEIGIEGYGHLLPGGVLEESKIPYNSSHYFIMTRSEKSISALKENGWTKGITDPKIRGWTDQYSNILSVIGNKAGSERTKLYKKKHREKSLPK